MSATENDDWSAVTVEWLATWLCSLGLAEEQAGYGHATGEDVALALLDHFHIAHKHLSTPTRTEGEHTG